MHLDQYDRLMIFAGPCRDGYVDLFENSAYCYMNTSRATHNFKTARKWCKRKGGDLATFSDKNQTDYFLSTAYHKFRFGYRKFKSSKYLSN